MTQIHKVCQQACTYVQHTSVTLTDFNTVDKTAKPFEHSGNIIKHLFIYLFILIFSSTNF